MPKKGLTEALLGLLSFHWRPDPKLIDVNRKSAIAFNGS